MKKSSPTYLIETLLDNGEWCPFCLSNWHTKRDATLEKERLERLNPQEKVRVAKYVREEREK